MDHIILQSDVYKTLVESIGNQEPECGAIIGISSERRNMVTAVWVDEIAGNGKASYRPSRHPIDTVVASWKTQGIDFGGIFHSHKIGFPKLSSADLASACRIMKSNHLNRMIMGLFCGTTMDVYWVFPTKEDRVLTQKADFVVK